MELTIVCIAYNREDSLSRLVSSIQNAHFPKGHSVRLLISIDKSDNEKVLEFANGVVWNHGPKEIIAHPENLGLRKHVFSCMELTEKFDRVIILEDDCFVSPQMLNYACEAFEFYENDLSVCGISLYAFDINEFVRMPFIPIEDGFDNYFIQVPSSWGQCFNKRMWLEFKSVFQKGDTVVTEDDFLPKNLLKWERSWKKDYFKFMKDWDKYFVCPRVSLSTNFADIGANFTAKNNRNQVNLLLGAKQLTFSKLGESKAIYDSFYELKSDLFGLNLDQKFEVDLYGFKDLSKSNTKLALSTKDLAGEPEMSFAQEMYPVEMNVIQNISGNDIYLGSCVKFSKELSVANKKRSPAYQKVDNYVIKKINTDLVENYMKKTWEYKIGRIFTLPFRWFKKG